MASSTVDAPRKRQHVSLASTSSSTARIIQSRVGLDTVAVKRIDAQTVERSGKVGGDQRAYDTHGLG